MAPKADTKDARGTMAHPDAETAKEKLLFCAELRPHRSASLGAVKVVSLFVLAVFIPTGIVFALVGAWPVFGFMGLEVAALIFLLRWHHRSGYSVETLRLTAEALRIERRDPWGRRRCWAFQPHWLQVKIEATPTGNNRLELRSHGKALVIGAFMAPEDRVSLAAALREKLRQLTSADMTADAALR